MTLNEMSLKVCGTAWITLASQLEAGYVPTLRPHIGRDKATIAYNAAVTKLADKLEELGYRVWRGTN